MYRSNTAKLNERKLIARENNKFSKIDKDLIKELEDYNITILKLHITGKKG